jgi:hypothetical protein
MINLDYYRTALLALFVGLFTGVSAQAQTMVSNDAPATSSTAVFARNTTTAGETSATHTTLQLSQPPAPATLAAFYDSSHKDLSQSLAWMQESNAVAPTYWNLYTESRIRLQLQDYAGAHAAAEQSYKLALNAMPVSQEYIALSKAVMAKAQQLASR